MQLRFDAANAPGLSERVRERTIKLAGQRATKDGVIVIEAGRFRTQEQNRADARARLDSTGRQGRRAAAAAAQEDQAVERRGRTAAEEQGRALDRQEAARPGLRRLAVTRPGEKPQAPPTFSPKVEKNWPASFFEVEEISLLPNWAILPPTSALAE